MLHRCCTTTLLLLVVGCAQCLNDTFDDCLRPLCDVHSDEDGGRYMTRVAWRTSVYGSVVGFTSHTVNAEGTVVSRVNVTFTGMSPIYINWDHVQRVFAARLFWVTKSPFVKDFWLGDWPTCSRLSVHVFNMSLNQTYVSNLRKFWLTELELTGNGWTTTSDLTLSLKHLEKLRLSDNQIEDLYEGLLLRCPSLEVLDLSRNKIRNYSNVVLSLMPVRGQLKELNLAENIISDFKNSLWYLRWHIKKLNLSYNLISSVDLHGIPKDGDVDLSFNNITEFPKSLYSFRVDRMVLAGQNISSLSEVGTILSNIDREMFEYSVPNVELVYANRKRTSVRALYIQQSECTVDGKYTYCLENGSNVFPKRESTFVNLTGNAVKVPVRSVFEIWPENLVDLTQNYLKDLKDIPAQISDAKQLNFSRNSIGYISSRLFQNMTRLTVLDLSYNHLKHVQLILYSSLFMLDISNNYLNRTNISHISSKYTTECLNLSHNSFTNILKAEWSQFEQFSKVDLGENNFECCGPEGQYSRIMFLHYINKILNINSTKALSCVMPPYGRLEMTITWLSEEHCQNNIDGWVAFGCLLLLIPLLIHVADLLDYFFHQMERDLAHHLIRLKKQGLEQDENHAPECKYDAFVCHSHKNVRWVQEELVPNLENDRDGHRLCIHYRDFPLGSLIEENIEKAMKKSRKVIVVVTRPFLESYWCKMELTYAWIKMVSEGRNYIIVIEVDRLPKDKRPPILSYLMHSRTYLEWPEKPTDDLKQSCWNRVRDALGKSLRDRQQELLESGAEAFQIDC